MSYSLLLLPLYVLIILLYIWATIKFFKATNSESKRNRNIYTYIVTPTIMVQLYLIIKNTHNNIISISVSFIFLLASLIIFILSIRENIKYKLNYAFCETTTLTTSGPYRYIRHPLYTSYMLTWLGGFIGSNFYIGIIILIPHTLYYYNAAKREEELFVSSQYSKEYTAYKARTGRFLPKITLKK